MRRRDFIKVIAGSIAARPLAARAQQADMPVVGYLESGSREPMAQRLASFRNGLSETGFVEGQNVAIDIAGRKMTTVGYQIWRSIWYAVR